MLRFLRKFYTFLVRRNEGVAAVEFGIVAPIALAALLLAGNTAFVVFEHQKVSAAAVASVNYLQDMSLNGKLSGLAPQTDPQSGEKSDGNLIATAKLIVKDAYGANLNVESITVDAYCGCPKSKPETVHGFDDSQGFYSRTELSPDSTGNVCPANCANSRASRIIAEISIDHTTKDLFGKEKQITERVVTRLR